MSLSPRLAIAACLAIVLSAGIPEAQAGLVAHYTFDEGTGVTVHNSLGTLDAVVQNNTSPGWTAGHIGSGALAFSGSDWAEASGNPLNGASSFSVTWWMNTTQGSKDAGIISADNGGGSRFMIWRNNSALYAGSSFISELGADNYRNDGAWHHYALIKENNVGWQLYRDGVVVDTATAQATFTQGNSPLRFARHSNPAEGCRWAGTLDDVAMWDETISAQQVALIYGLGTLAGVNVGDSAIQNVLNAFNAGSGHYATAGAYSWRYATASELGSASTTIGTLGGQLASQNAYIILDSSGNGILYNGAVNGATVGAGTAIPLESVDTANGPRTNVDRGYARLLAPGQYKATEFTFAAGQRGSVIPFLAKLVGPDTFEILAFGDQVTVDGPASVSEPQLITVTFGGEDCFVLDEATWIYVGFTNPSGTNNPVLFDNGTTTTTAHRISTVLITAVGQTVGGFSSYPNLARTYAVAVTIRAVPEPATSALAAVGLMGLIGGGLTRRSK